MNESHKPDPTGIENWDGIFQDYLEVGPTIFLFLTAMLAAAAGFLWWKSADGAFVTTIVALVTLAFGIAPYFLRAVKR